MREFIRMHAPGAQFFLTLVSACRAQILTADDDVARLRAAFAKVKERHPFTIWGAVILPDHLHVLIELPPGDANFSIRIGLIKSAFKPAGPRPVRPLPRTRLRRRERDVWQRRFWEHTIRDEVDFEAHMDYIHYNPVKHGHAACPHAWPYSSFHQWVREGRYAADWACSCERATPVPSGALRAERTAGG